MGCTAGVSIPLVHTAVVPTRTKTYILRVVRLVYLIVLVAACASGQPRDVASFEAVLRANPNSHEARYNLGLALLQDGQTRRAVKELELLVKQTPDSPPAHVALGMALMETGDLPSAEAQHRTALK